MKIPRRSRGNQSEAQREQYQKEVAVFCDTILQIRSSLDFEVGSRGWCYLLEEYGLSKADFDQAQALIGDCRKDGSLPIDIVSEDQAREFHCEETVHGSDVEGISEGLRDNVLSWWEEYIDRSFWENQNHYVQMLVEKIDLRSLFKPVCDKYRVRIGNAKGWSDIGQRANMMRKFGYWEEQGKQCVLLYCGDHDPSGLVISEYLRGNLREMRDAVGWDPGSLIIDRFGLNYDFIQSAGLTWIENLITGSGKNLADPKHKDHRKPYVQDYIRSYGIRKCEANALVKRPDLGRQLCHDAILKYIDEAEMEIYQAEVEVKRHEMKEAVENRFREQFGGEVMM